MKLFTLILALAGLTGAAGAVELLPIEQQVGDAIKSPDVTVVHFWAPWCPNCEAELANNGWSTFIDMNSEANFIFVTAKHPEDGR